MVKTISVQVIFSKNVGIREEIWNNEKKKQIFSNNCKYDKSFSST